MSSAVPARVAGAGYFTQYHPVYFTQYHPGSGTVRVSLPRTFIAAVRLALRHDATLNGKIAGRVWKDLAPRGVAYPFLVLAETSSDPMFSTVDRDDAIPFVDHKTFTVTAYALNAEAARLIVLDVLRVLDDAPVRFAEGVLMELRHDQGYHLSIDGSGSYGGSKAWQGVIPYEAYIQKSFPAR
jgi:hypothetical protein